MACKFEKVSKSVCLPLNEIHFSLMKARWQEIKDIFIFLSTPYYNSNAFFPCQGAWWTHEITRQNVISKGPLSLSLLWQLLLRDPQLCEMRWVLLCDYLCKSLKQFYVKLKKIMAKIGNLCLVSGVINWAGLFCSLSSCLLKGARTFCCCHIAMVASWFTSAECKQQHWELFDKWQFPW